MRAPVHVGLALHNDLCLLYNTTAGMWSTGGNWTIRRTIALIEYFRTCRCLWDSSDPDYKRRTAKDEAYEAIGRALGIPPHQVEAKVQALRNQFRRELRRMEAMARSGLPPQKPLWFAYEHLLFLTQHYHSRESRQLEARGLDPQLPLQLSPVQPTSLVKEECLSPSQPPQPASPEHLLERSRSPVQWQGDEYSAYGHYVASEIKKMSPRAQTVVRHLINGLLFDGLTGKLDHDDVTSVPGSPPLEHTSVSQDQLEPDRPQEKYLKAFSLAAASQGGIPDFEDIT